MINKTVRRSFLVLAFVIMMGVVAPRSVSAHAYLIRSDPVDGSVMTVSPETINLWFDEPIAPKFSSIQLFDADSQAVEIIDLHVDSDDPYHLLFSSADPLPDGVYSVLYQVLSEADGHITKGLFVFGVGEDADLQAASIADSKDALPPATEVGLRWFNFVMLAGLIGALVMVHVVIRPLPNPNIQASLEKIRRRILQWAIWSGIGAFWGGIGLLVWQVILLLSTLPESTDFLEVSWQIMSRTRWGLLWDGRQLLLLLSTFSLVVLRKRPFAPMLPRLRAAWIITALLTAALIVVQSLMGHASAVQPNTTLAIIADSLHILGASVWVGGLLSLIVGLLPLMRQRDAHFSALIKGMLRPFGVVAAISVGLLFATGLYSVGGQVASIDALITTLYGQTLLAKIGLMLGVGIFGLLNSMLLHPRVAKPMARLLRRPEGWTPFSLQQLPKLLMAEVGLGLLVFLLTSMVTASPTPRGVEYTIVPEEVPDALTETVDDMVITLFAKPNRPGQNVFTIFASSTRRPAPAEVARVITRFSYQEQELGQLSADAEEVESARFLLTGNYFSVAGAWQVDVVVRRLGMEDSVASFSWIVPPPGDVQPTILSKQPLGQSMTIAAAAVLLLMLLIIGWIRVQEGMRKKKVLAIDSQLPLMDEG